MFICAELLQDVKIGEVIVVKYDANTNGLGAFLITGEKVGQITSHQADGCIDFWTIATRIENNKILCHAIIKGGRLLILATDSRLLAGQVERGIPSMVNVKESMPLFAMRR